MSLLPLKNYLLSLFLIIAKASITPLPPIKLMRKKYLKRLRKQKKEEPKTRNNALMEQFPSIRKKPLLYFFLNRDFKPAGMRILMLIISAIWFAIFPIYIFVIFMYEKGFFSYEFFTTGVFGLKSFFLVMMLFIIMISIYLYGFLILGRLLIIDYIKNKSFPIISRLIFWTFVVLAIVFHLWLFRLTSIIGKTNLFYTLLASSFILVLYFCSFIRVNKSDSVVNWVPSAAFIFVSISLPFFNTSNVAAAVEIGLKKFSVGPGQKVTVFDKSNTEAIASGHLLLWSPEFVYFNDDTGKLHAYPTKHGTHLVIEKYNKQTSQKK